MRGVTAEDPRLAPHFILAPATHPIAPPKGSVEIRAGVSEVREVLPQRNPMLPTWLA